jgi:hypothetical protein
MPPGQAQTNLQWFMLVNAVLAHDSPGINFLHLRRLGKAKFRFLLTVL